MVCHDGHMLKVLMIRYALQLLILHSKQAFVCIVCIIVYVVCVDQELMIYYTP